MFSIIALVLFGVGMAAEGLYLIFRKRELTERPVKKQHYIKLLYTLLEQDGMVTLEDIGMSCHLPRSVVKNALKYLVRSDMVYFKNKCVVLTQNGRRTAQKVLFNYETACKYLVELGGVNPRVAQKVACKLEQVLDYDSMQQQLAG